MRPVSSIWMKNWGNASKKHSLLLNKCFSFILLSASPQGEADFFCLFKPEIFFRYEIQPVALKRKKTYVNFNSSGIGAVACADRVKTSGGKTECLMLFIGLREVNKK